MLNYEKYKDELENIENRSLVCFIAKEKVGSQYCDLGYCSKCEKKAFKWLTSEYEEPILDDIEKEYLKNVIEPFGDYVAYVIKFATSKLDFLSIYISVNEEKVRSFEIPLMYDLDSMFKNIKYDERYTLEEL